MNIFKGVNRKEVFLIILFELGFGLKFNLIGEISISEVFLIIYFLTHFFTDSIRKNRDFKHIYYLYICLFLFQCLSELMVGNKLDNSLKGISVTVVSFFHLYFLIKLFIKNKLLAMWALVGMLLRGYIWGGDISGDVDSALSGEDATFLKFYIAPIITYIILIYSVIKPKKTTSAVFMYVGVFFIIAGTRSSGGTVFLTGVISWLILNKNRISKKTVYKYSFLILAIGYSSYYIYVDYVMSGNIKSGNNQQLFRAENPYNPINLLMVGRSETFVGLQAFMDKPLWGYGSWKLDSETGYKYSILRYDIQNSESERMIFKSTDRIPCHSVIVGWGTYNGIFVFIMGLFIIIYTYKRGFQSLQVYDSMNIMLIFCLLQGCWHALFSPPSHFRYSLPLYMAFSVVSYWKVKASESEVKYKNKLSVCNVCK